MRDEAILWDTLPVKFFKDSSDLGSEVTYGLVLNCPHITVDTQGIKSIN